MGWHRHIRDEIAPETCPLIDHVQKHIKEALTKITSINSKMEYSEIESILEDVVSLIDKRDSVYNFSAARHVDLSDTMELIRDHNGSLRKSLVEALENNDELDSKNDDLRDEVKSHENTIEELQSDKSSLEDDIRTLQNKLDDKE